jgi:hypothetical protein
MTDFADVNGLRVVSGSLTMPYFGAWVADFSLATDKLVPSGPMACTVTMGNQTLIGTVFRQASFAGQTSVRLVAGAGGWRKAVPSQHYQASGGLSLRTMVQDAAIVVGEQVNVATDQIVGGDYVRENAAAEEVIRQLFGSGWWIAPSGVTQLAPRAGGQIRTPFTAIEWEGARGKFTIATEDYQGWVPGTTFVGPTVPTMQTVSSVSYVVDNDGIMRLDVLATDPGDLDRLITPIDAVIRASAPRTTYAAIWEYSVQAVNGSFPNITVDLAPTASIPLPTMKNIALRPSVLGATSKPTISTKALVAFANGDPTKPVVIGIDAADTMSMWAGEIDLGMNPTDALGLASKVDAAINYIITKFNLHTHATAAVGPPVIPVPLMTAQPSVASTVVKAE